MRSPDDTPVTSDNFDELYNKAVKELELVKTKIDFEKTKRLKSFRIDFNLDDSNWNFRSDSWRDFKRGLSNSNTGLSITTGTESEDPDSASVIDNPDWATITTQINYDKHINTLIELSKKNLKQMNEKLKECLEREYYRPGGPGYEIARNHFETTLEDEHA